ncbi:hypothetical protein [Ensifer adhaerens]
MEFHGAGDPYFGGTAADWALHKTGDGGQAFVSAADAQRRNSATEAEQAGTAASTRKGRISALPGKLRSEVPTGQISWVDGNKHVGEDDSELAKDIADRAKRAGATDADLIAQMVAYALACHRANQALVIHFQLQWGRRTMRHERRSVEVFDTPSDLGGSHTVSIVQKLAADRVQVRVWYGRATPRGWEPWKDRDGYTFATERATLTNKRTMPLFK